MDHEYTRNRFYDEGTGDSVVQVDVNGFDRYFTYNFHTSIGTTIYGLFNFEKDPEKIQNKGNSACHAAFY